MWKCFERIQRRIAVLARGQPGRMLVLAGLTLVVAGCYTMLKHPSVVDEERALAQKDSTGQEHTQITCNDCHNNQYDHGLYNRWNWGWGDWGYSYGGLYPFGYYNYNPWRHYYYDPWWYGGGWGWGGWGGYYDPYPYYPGPGGGTPGTPPVPRDQTRRGMPAAPPSYNPPPPENQGAQPQQPNQQNNNEKKEERKGRRGSG